MIEVFFYTMGGIILLSLGGLGYFTIYRLTNNIDSRTQSQNVSLMTVKDTTATSAIILSNMENRLRSVEIALETQSNFLRDFQTRLAKISQKPFEEKYIPLPDKKQK